MIRLAAAAEMSPGKPVIAINRYPPKHAPGAQEKQPAQSTTGKVLKALKRAHTV